MSVLAALAALAVTGVVVTAAGPRLAGEHRVRRRVATQPDGPAVPSPLGAAVRTRLGRLGRRRHDEQALGAATLDELGRALRGGHAISGALDRAARTDGVLASGFASVARGVEAGRPLDDALADLAGRISAEPELEGAVGLVRCALRLGGPLADGIDAAARSLREERALRAEAVAQGSQARASGWLIAALPVAVLAVGIPTVPGVGSFLFATPAGLAVLVGGLAADAAGIVWMQRLTATATR